MATPAWVMVLLLVVLRAVILVVGVVGWILLVIVDFFADIGRDVQNIIWDVLLWPVVGPLLDVGGWLYAILVWPVLVAFNIL